MLADGFVHGGISDTDTAVVTDVFTYGKLSVCHEARDDLNYIELVYKHLGLGIELVGILFCPPVHHVAVFVEETSLVIETM